jgi:hypothetical protein
VNRIPATGMHGKDYMVEVSAGHLVIKSVDVTRAWRRAHALLVEAQPRRDVSAGRGCSRGRQRHGSSLTLTPLPKRQDRSVEGRRSGSYEHLDPNDFG